MEVYGRTELSGQSGAYEAILQEGEVRKSVESVYKFGVGEIGGR